MNKKKECELSQNLFHKNNLVWHLSTPSSFFNQNMQTHE